MSTSATASGSDRLLTTKEAADRLKQHVKSVRRSCREGRIPSKRIGGRVYIPESALHIPADVDHEAERQTAEAPTP
ncbi:MAG TPA: helix-turn-helix domain-containing protein [bacterium]|nr:helix-turn-helix domain-containing protein [bacterium]